MLFYNYMIRRYKRLDSSAGWLAHAMRMDRERFPKNSIRKLEAWKPLIFGYMKSHPELYSGCMDAFENCWEDYVKCEKSRLSRNSSRR